MTGIEPLIIIRWTTTLRQWMNERRCHRQMKHHINTTTSYLHAHNCTLKVCVAVSSTRPTKATETKLHLRQIDRMPNDSHTILRSVCCAAAASRERSAHPSHSSNSSLAAAADVFARKVVHIERCWPARSFGCGSCERDFRECINYIWRFALSISVCDKENGDDDEYIFHHHWRNRVMCTQGLVFVTLCASAPAAALHTHRACAIAICALLPDLGRSDIQWCGYVGGSNKWVCIFVGSTIANNR